jgi:hypothetical protein
MPTGMRAYLEDLVVDAPMSPSLAGIRWKPTVCEIWLTRCQLDVVYAKHLKEN